MKRKRTDSREGHNGSRHAMVLLYGILATVVTSLAFGGWYARNYVAEELASKSEVIVAGSQARAALDNEMKRLISQIALLEAKPRKTPEDIAQLQYMRQELERLRQLRSLR